MRELPKFHDPNLPLVSILIFNYNYGKYLRECFDSVLKQTYANIEINFSDNNSSDDSWEIALEYERNNPGIITVTKNRQNFGADANFNNCWSNARGKYFIEMCSDDVMGPTMVEKCVKVLEENQDCGFAMVHRGILDDESNLTTEPPFYNMSCIIPGAEQAAVYMMAAVNPSISQIMYVKSKTFGNSVTGGMAGRWYGTRVMDFNMTCKFPIAYIKEPLLLHRLHMQNDSFHAAGNLMEVIGPYVLQHQFADTARIYGFKKAEERLPASIEKVSSLSLRYAARALSFGEEENAFQYFHLAAALFPKIVENQLYQQIETYWNAPQSEKEHIVKQFEETSNLISRSVSYDAPPNSIKNE